MIMTETIKEIADELGVSRQYIQKIISKLPATKKPTKVQHIYSIDKSKATNELSTKYEKSLLENIAKLRSQVEKKDTQLDSMQKLLDQPQQLQLIAENKIKQLEDKDDKSDIHKETPELTIKHGFWNRWFS